MHYKSAQVRSILRIPQHKIEYWIQSGKLKPDKDASGDRVFSEADVDQMRRLLVCGTGQGANDPAQGRP